MIYTRFGTKLTPISKQEDSNGRISIQAAAEGTDGVRDYLVDDLTADDGMPEINDAAAKLPWKVEKQTQPRPRKWR